MLLYIVLNEWIMHSKFLSDSHFPCHSAFAHVTMPVETFSWSHFFIFIPFQNGCVICNVFAYIWVHMFVHEHIHVCMIHVDM